MKENKNYMRIILGLFAFVLIVGILMGYVLGFVHTSSVLTSEYNDNLRWHYAPFKLNSTSFYSGVYDFNYRVDNYDYVCYRII